MQDVFNFLADCRARVASAVPSSLRRDAPTPKRQIVDQVIHLFTTGYNAALETEPDRLAQQVADVDYFRRSVIFAGAYAAVASLDLNEGANWERLQQLMSVASENVVSIHEGIGHALSQQRMHVNFDPSVTSTFWGWMAMDGYGCNAGYFRWPGVIGQLQVPSGLDEFGIKAFDQGLGRAIWLVCAADPKTIVRTICEFPPERRANLWNGVGIMVGCWGTDDSGDMRRLLVGSARWRPWLQSGVAFSTKARALAGPLPDFVKEACHTICQAPDAEVVSVVDRSMAALDGPAENSAMFCQWKQLMTAEFSRN